MFNEIQRDLKDHPVIGAHIKQMVRAIDTEPPEPPAVVRAMVLSDSGDYAAALPLWEAAWLGYPGDPFVAYGYANAMVETSHHDDAADFVITAPIDTPNKTYFLLRCDRNQEVIDLATTSLSDRTVANAYHPDQVTGMKINRGIALKRLGRITELNAELDSLENERAAYGVYRDYFEAGIAALRGHKDRMLVAIKAALHQTISPDQLMIFPVFEDYREDPDFSELVDFEAEI